ncbi:uncharacterized protein [Maniola hyperantus]|uniref:uncharacterized protein n=1 Tax=Aphantopus hyperantus TaxID=2795564 RepID=UPI0037494ACC
MVNAQCVAISAYASVYSSLKKRLNFTCHEINSILSCGDELYARIVDDLKRTHRFQNDYLDPDSELPSEIRVGNFSAQITNNWVANGIFPRNGEVFNVASSILALKNLLAKEIFNESHVDSTDNYLITGQLKTMSFWRHNGSYYLFNSHGVDETNKRNNVENLNVARLFCSQNIEAFATFIIKSYTNSNDQYQINKIRIENLCDFNDNLPVQPILNDLKLNILKPVVVLQKLDTRKINKRKASTNENIISDPKLNFFKPVVVMEKLDSRKIKKQKASKDENIPAKKITVDQSTDIKLNMNPVVVINKIDTSTICKKQVGRPKKLQRGRKSTKQNAHLDASKKYNENNPAVHRIAVKTYTAKNPEVNQKAVKTYTAKNPEVNQKAVKTYTTKKPEVNTASVQRYNITNRNVEPELRGLNLIAQKRDEELHIIKLFSLKKSSLLSLDAHVCSICQTRLFFEEKTRTKWCCGQGAYNVQNLEPLTEEFYSHTSFLNRPRAYNNLFAFSALGVSHGYQQPNTGITFLKIQGRVYHRVFDLGYSDSANPIGMYVHDDNETRERQAQNLNLDMQVIRSITNFIHNVNPYIECFKRLNRETSENAHIIFEQTSRCSHGNILGDLPLGREVAAIIRTEVEQFTPHCIAIWKEGHRSPHTVDILHPCFESFQYPLLYPYGNPGWYPNKLDNKGSKLTQLKYIRCLLLSESRFSEFNRLSEEWIIDMFNRISDERLRYISNMQTKNSDSALRSAPLHEIEALNNDETIQGEGGIVPGKIYLPYSFTGSPRYMKLKYLDSIALVNRLGQPSYFITITCNPNWVEIKQSVPSGQKANPLICARVFNLKLAQLIKDIRSGKWFGNFIYLMYVIEFQKRGLPHAHVCFRVEGGGPVHNTDIDKFVRADIPNPSEAEGRLRKAVLDHMIHGPCGPPNRTDLPCWDDEKKKCSKFFPKRETDTTFCDDRGFVNLKRNSQNEAEITYRGRKIKINDRWVVPYNAALLLKYDCHLNVEVSTATAVVKYLFKYITKGADHSRVAVVLDENRNDEIENYVTKRYLGSCEATWRILEFDLVCREPNVKQLAVHLEGQQYVYFKPGTETEAANRTTSDLITYFNRPAGINFDELTYQDFYEKYIVHATRPRTKNVEILETTNNRFVTQRQRGELVARLFFVAPNRGEQFYLRLLLASHPCRSYRDLLNLGGPDCMTFQEAAKTIGLANDEAEYEKAMTEACAFFTGPRLRNFFVLLAVNGIPVASLWTKFRDQISEDFIHRQPDNIDRAYHSCLVAIDRLLRKHGTCLIEQGLPDVSDNTTELGREQTEYNRNTLRDFVNDWLPKLSPEQNEIFEFVNKLVTNQSFRGTQNSAIFIDGPGGTGKTLILNVITAHVRGNLNGIVLCTASSGIAAQNHENGTTAHSMFRFPLNLVDDLEYWNITNGSQRAELIFNANVIIFDEAPMAHKWLIHLLERSLRDLMKNDKIFGGKIIIFAGDYRQIPPVVVHARSNSDVFNASVKSSPIWQKLKTFSLITSQRCRDDSEFSEFLLKLGSNQLTSVTLHTNRTVENLINLSIISFVLELDDLIDFVYPNVVLNEPDVCVHRAILSTHNASVYEINAKILELLPEDPLHFYSIDEVVSDNADQIFLGVDALNRMHPKGIPEHDLTLKVGCVCMIMRNLNFSDKLVNGTKVIVVNTSPRLITVRKPGLSDDYLIPRIIFKAPIETGSPIEMCRRQFPLQVCYAMTIHKSQGQTICRVGVDLRSDVFSHGQLYVALSRVQHRQNIKILVNKERVINGNPLANNVVYPPLL